MGSRPLVLAVDDDAGVLETLHLILDGDCDVLDARDGEAALALIRARHVDLVLLDLLLDGDLDGITLLKTLRKDGSEVPVVIVSGVNRAAPAATAIRLGAADYVTKPFDEDELLGVIGSVLRWRDTAAGSRPALRAPGLLLIGCPVGLGAALAAALTSHARVDCRPATQGATAIMPSNIPDLIVVDVDSTTMPTELFARIRTHWPSAPVVVVGAPGRCREALSDISDDATTALLKPLTARDLLETMRRQLAGTLRPLPPFSPTVTGVMEYVSGHYARISASELGRALGKTPYYLSRLFRLQTGLPLKTYVNRVRVEAARQLLAEGGDKIETVASLVGCHDGSHLSRMFLKHLGQRPRDVRRTSGQLPEG